MLPNKSARRWNGAPALVLPLTLYAVCAQADVTISSGTTENMNCSAGVCQPTASSAVLNVTDLENLLASGNVKVTTTGQSVQANNIVVSDGFSWTNASAIALDAYQSVSIASGIAVQGQGGLALTTNDGGTNGTLAFGHQGSVTFANLSSSLNINGASYTLVNTIKSLASAIAANRSGNYAFASNYDASVDGTYTTVPIPTPFTGTFEGLGNAISKLAINDATDTNVDLFAEVDSGGILRDIAVTNANIVISSTDSCAAPLVGDNGGSIIGAFASGSAESTNSCAGGLAGYDLNGSIELSSATTETSGLVGAGGLVGILADGSIDQSFASGKASSTENAGGLAGGGNGNSSTITNCYSTGEARAPKSSQAHVGGFLSQADGTIGDSYSTGLVKGGSAQTRGGFVGTTSETTFADDYWDLDKSGVTNRHKGAGNVKNQTGIEGLTTKQFRSGLPGGFDPSIWSEDKKINNGLPYLLANPPR